MLQERLTSFSYSRARRTAEEFTSADTACFPSGEEASGNAKAYKGKARQDSANDEGNQNRRRIGEWMCAGGRRKASRARNRG